MLGLPPASVLTSRGTRDPRQCQGLKQVGCVRGKHLQSRTSRGLWGGSHHQHRRSPQVTGLGGPLPTLPLLRPLRLPPFLPPRSLPVARWWHVDSSMVAPASPACVAGPSHVGPPLGVLRADSWLWLRDRSRQGTGHPPSVVPRTKLGWLCAGRHSAHSALSGSTTGNVIMTACFEIYFTACVSRPPGLSKHGSVVGNLPHRPPEL